MNETLLVISSDSKKLNKWMQTWGRKMKNITVVPTTLKRHLEGWDKKSTFFTVITPNPSVAEDLKGYGYRYVPREKLEGRLKGITVTNTPTT
jgi:hypothetical protein